jgi:hypothetical protein
MYVYVQFSERSIFSSGQQKISEKIMEEKEVKGDTILSKTTDFYFIFFHDTIAFFYLVFEYKKWVIKLFKFKI